MNWLSHSIHLMFLLDCVLASLPAPCNLSVDSVHFRHILHWDPGPGSPAGTQYKVFARLRGSKEKEPQNTTTMETSLQLDLDNYKYYLSVQALHNGTWSAASKEIPFNPIEQTIIGPPKVILAENGNSFQINISLPEADKSSKIRNNNIMGFYGAKFKVLWRKSKEIEGSIETKENSVTLHNLEAATQYCVQVQIVITMNKNTKPSDWVCTFTDGAGSRVSFIGTIVGSTILGICVVMALLCGLHIAGLLGKLKETVPNALNNILAHASWRPLQEVIPDLISTCSETHRQKDTSALFPATNTTSSGEEEYDEDDEESKVYIDRNTENTVGPSLCREYDVFRTDQSTQSQDSQSSTIRSDTKADTADSALQTVPGEEESRVEQGESNKWFETAIKVQATCESDEEMKENICDISEDVDLFTVTLDPLAVQEKENLNSTNLNLSDQELFMSTPTNRTLLQEDQPTDSDDLKPTQPPDLGEACCESSDEDDDDEEEQSAGYIGR
ncbi:cytokine receptor family member b1 [Nerophis ophidion]|uniref:cytokine receptor family member b1 n=1 Tax=Nerophis ophidion TaxID=159077 RepID=UPI002ADF2D73|nr:cytokine receptor family member b1 [Nerophis ophidion]XP_061774594.1 cytokine receptor family member b1 [Nerophis ophidion]